MNNRRTIYIKNALSAEIDRHAASIDADDSISKIQLTIILGRHSGLPERVSYMATTSTRLTDGRALLKMRVSNQRDSRS